MIDKSTDCKQRYISNVLVGKLDGSSTQSMLLTSVALTETNHTTVSQAVIKACNIIWPVKLEFEKLKLIVSDQAKGSSD